MGPKTGASMMGMPTTALARARSACGKASKASVGPMGSSMPPPMPCNARNAISQLMLGETPQSSEPRVKTLTPRRNMRLRPKRLAR